MYPLWCCPASSECTHWAAGLLALGVPTGLLSVSWQPWLYPLSCCVDRKLSLWGSHLWLERSQHWSLRLEPGRRQQQCHHPWTEHWRRPHTNRWVAAQSASHPVPVAWLMTRIIIIIWKEECKSQGHPWTGKTVLHLTNTHTIIIFTGLLSCTDMSEVYLFSHILVKWCDWAVSVFTLVKVYWLVWATIICFYTELLSCTDMSELYLFSHKLHWHCIS